MPHILYVNVGVVHKNMRTASLVLGGEWAEQKCIVDWENGMWVAYNNGAHGAGNVY